MMMAIAWNKFSHSESLHKSGSAYKAPHFLTNRRHVPPKPFSHSLDRLRTFLKASLGSFSAGRQYGVCWSDLMQMRVNSTQLCKRFASGHRYSRRNV